MLKGHEKATHVSKRIKLRYEMFATQAMVQNCQSPGVIFPKYQALPPL